MLITFSYTAIPYERQSKSFSTCIQPYFLAKVLKTFVSALANALLIFFPTPRPLQAGCYILDLDLLFPLGQRSGHLSFDHF